jgi:hypothetical protein
VSGALSAATLWPADHSMTVEKIWTLSRKDKAAGEQYAADLMAAEKCIIIYKGFTGQRFRSTTSRSCRMPPASVSPALPFAGGSQGKRFPRSGLCCVKGPPETVRMQALIYIYVFAVWCVGAILLRVVSRFEPNPLLAAVLQFLILAAGAAAIASRFMH